MLGKAHRINQVGVLFPGLIWFHTSPPLYPKPRTSGKRSLMLTVLSFTPILLLLPFGHFFLSGLSARIKIFVTGPHLFCFQMSPHHQAVKDLILTYGKLP